MFVPLSDSVACDQRAIPDLQYQQSLAVTVTLVACQNAQLACMSMESAEASCMDLIFNNVRDCFASACASVIMACVDTALANA